MADEDLKFCNASHPQSAEPGSGWWHARCTKPPHDIAYDGVHNWSGLGYWWDPNSDRVMTPYVHPNHR